MKITDLLLGLGSIAAGVLTLINREFWQVGISLTIAGFLMLYFSEYISKISENEIDIKKLKEKLIIYERLSKLEARFSNCE